LDEKKIEGKLTCKICDKKDESVDYYAGPISYMMFDKWEIPSCKLCANLVRLHYNKYHKKSYSKEHSYRPDVDFE